MVLQKTEAVTQNIAIRMEEIQTDRLEKIKWFFRFADEKDIIILQKFYFTGKEFPYDTSPFCFPILYRKLKEIDLKWHQETLRKRLKKMVGCCVLEKTRGRNPTDYFPPKNENMIIVIKELIRRRAYSIKDSIEKIYK